MNSFSVISWLFFFCVEYVGNRFVVLKGVDDIKDTVRQAAVTTLRAIGKMTVRMANVEVTNTTSARRAVNVALPFLIDKGINNEVKDIQVCVVVLNIWCMPSFSANDKLKKPNKLLLSPFVENSLSACITWWKL